MKICAYVQEQYAKANYKQECLDTRQFIGLRVIIDCLKRAGYDVEYAGRATVASYDIVLVSLTSDCDWWSYISERVTWPKGGYKVVVGGAGVMHITPFLRWGDYFMFGRGENLIVPLVRAIERGEEFEHESVACSRTFSEDNIYRIAQAENAYEHTINVSPGFEWTEGMIGCNHKCLFCGYTWHRKCNFTSAFMWDTGKTNMTDKECAMLDWESGKYTVDWSRLRTTAIDGFSERLRFSVGKRITDKSVRMFLQEMIESDAKPHQIKLFNICGLPGETFEDWEEFAEVLKSTENGSTSNGKQWSIVLHSTPFRAMPATPMACKPMSKRNYRGEIAKKLGKGLKGNLIYQGRNAWAVESMGTESLSTVMLSAVAHRAGAGDCEAVEKLCRSKKFWKATGPQKEATLCKLFDMDRLFGEFSARDLPSRYLRTYAQVEKCWR